MAQRKDNFVEAELDVLKFQIEVQFDLSVIDIEMQNAFMKANRFRRGQLEECRMRESGSDREVCQRQFLYALDLNALEVIYDSPRKDAAVVTNQGRGSFHGGSQSERQAKPVGSHFWGVFPERAFGYGPNLAPENAGQ